MLRLGRRAARTGVAPTRHPRSARLRPAAGWVLTGVLVAVLVWFGWPTTLGGCTTLTIVSGHSMEPTYFTGDLVVSRCGVPDVGDVVVYTPQGVDQGRVIHRVVGGDAADGWAIRGDNNDFYDPWRPTQEDILGVATLHVPGLGRVASILLDPWAWVSLLVIAGGVLLWPSARPDADDPSAPTDQDPGDTDQAAPTTEPRELESAS